MNFEPLLKGLRALVAKRRLALGTAGIASAVAAVAALAVVTYALDRFLRLPVGVRGVHLALCAAGVFLVLRRSLFRPLAEPFGDQDAAMLVERVRPDLDDRLISALQLRDEAAAGRLVGSPELVEDAIRRTLSDVAPIDFRAAYDARHVRRPLGAAAVGLVLVCAGAAFAPQEFSIFVRRCLLLGDVRWPRATELKLVVVDGEQFARTSEDGVEVYAVPERTPLQVRVEAVGKTPSAVDLVVRTLDSAEKPRTFAMGRPGGKEYFQHIFPPLVQSLRLHATGGDDDDDEPAIEVRVSRAPRIQRFAAALTPPAYTGATPKTVSENNLVTPEGTRLRFRFEVNMPLAAFELAFDKAGVQTLSPGADGAYEYEFLLRQSDFYTYRLKGANGVNSVEAPRYVLTAEPDQLPRVQLELPAQTATPITPNALIPLRGTATDDHGVTVVEVRWSAADEGLAEALPLTTADLLRPLGSAQVPFYRDLSPADFRTPEIGARIRFKLLVADNRMTEADPEPHRQFGDYEYSLQVMAPADVERELVQRQSRLRERVRDLLALAESRLAETDALLAQGDAASTTDLAAKLAQIETGQNRITVELAGTGRQFMRIFEGYLYNRLDAGNLTEKLLVVMAAIYRGSLETDPFKIYGEALAQVRPQVTEGDLMGRLTVILDLFVRTAAERSPEAVRRLAQAGLTTNAADRVELLRGAKTQQQALIEDLRALEDRLEAWEDYLDVIQGLRDLIDLQKGVKGKAEKLTK
jgi:hypothetical protein